MTIRSQLLYTALFLFQLSAEAKIYGPKRYDSIGLLTFVGAEYYTTTENFNLNSKPTGLKNSGSYSLLDMPIGVRYAISPVWSFEAEMKASYAQSKSSDLITGGNRTNSEIHEIRVSSDMLIETRGFDWIPEVEIIFPLKKIDSNTDNVMVGEGAQSLIGRIHLQTEFGQGDFFSYIGYQMRDSGRSNLVPWSVGAGFNSGSSLLGARIFGFQSISDDTDKNSPFVRETLNNKVNGGSLKFYSINPAIISTEFLWFLKLSKQWQIQMNAGIDLAGQSYSKGLFAGINLILDWGEKQRFLRQRPKQEQNIKPEGSGLAVEPGTVDFREETNELKEQEYFTPPPPPRAKPIQPLRRSRSRNAPSDKQIKDQMNDVEMKIELKRKKK